MSVARLGYRVALIDADIGLRNLDLLLGLENRVMFTAMEVLDGECRLEQVRAECVEGFRARCAGPSALRAARAPSAPGLRHFVASSYLPRRVVAARAAGRG